MMLGIGYCAGALAPLVLGALRDATGSFHAGLWLIAASALGVLATCVACSPARLKRGVRDRERVRESV
jgi:cyanate permease